MSDVRPLTAEERAAKVSEVKDILHGSWRTAVVPRYEATVRAVEAERDDADAQIALRDERLAALTVERDALRDGVRNALARLDGHTCHEGHTDADHLRLYRQVVGEIEDVLRERRDG